MRILAITNQFPLPQDMGGPLRILGLMRALADAHELHVLAVRRPETSDDLAAELGAQVGAHVEVFAAPPRARPGTRSTIDRWVRSLRRGMPPWVLQQFHPRLCQRAIALAPGVSVVVLLDDYAGAYAPWLSRLAPVVADKHGVAGWSRVGAGSSWRHVAHAPAASAARALERHLTRRFERLVSGHAAAVVVTSDEEAGRFEELYGVRPGVVPSAIELPATCSLSPEGRRIGWLGTHAYAPNADGLVRFVEGGWDAIGVGFELLVAGGGVTPQVRRLERHRGVNILGYVEDLAEFTGRLNAAVVPLWDGAPGPKLKMLTLMGAGVPLACTPVAAEGLGAKDGRHCLIADDPAGLVAALHSILDDAALASRLATEGRQLVRDGFTWETVDPRFVAVVERAARLGRAAD